MSLLVNSRSLACSSSSAFITATKRSADSLTNSLSLTLAAPSSSACSSSISSSSSLQTIPCSSSTCSLRHYSSSSSSSSSSLRIPGPPLVESFKDQALDDESEFFLRSLSGVNYVPPAPTTPTPKPNAFAPPPYTFLPLGQSWADAHPSSQATELVHSTPSSPVGGHSQPFIYQSGGFIPANSVAALSLPSGPGSVSGIVATVFGGNGFLGRHLLAYLGRIGAQIIVPYRGDGMNVRRTKLAGEVGQVVPIPYSWDNLDPVVKAIQRSNVVINLIGQKKETTNFSYDDVHVKCTYKIAELAKKYGNIERFIHVSCIGANPRSPSAFYRSKGEGENVVRHFFPSATILRSAPFYGPDDNFLNYIGRSIVYNYNLHLFNEGQQKVAPTHVNDVAQAILASIAFGESLGELYHLVGPKTYTALQLVLMAYKEAHADVFRDYKKIKVNKSLEADKFAYWWRSIVHSHLFDHHDASNSVSYVLGGILNQMSAQIRVNPDQIVQSYVDQVIPDDIKETAKTYADLNIQAQKLESHLPALMLTYTGTRGVERFAEIERKTFTATRPM